MNDTRLRVLVIVEIICLLFILMAFTSQVRANEIATQPTVELDNSDWYAGRHILR